MTAQEQKSIDSLRNMISELATANRQFREDVNKQIEAINNRVEQKHIPLSMEQEIINSATVAIQKGLSEALSNSYNSPLAKYANNVVAKYQSSIEGIFDKVVEQGIQTDEFKQRVNEVLMSKIAKTMISGIDGSIDKTINLMKQDPIFRSRLTLSVNNLVNEFLSDKK